MHGRPRFKARSEWERGGGQAQPAMVGLIQSVMIRWVSSNEGRQRDVISELDFGTAFTGFPKKDLMSQFIRQQKSAEKQSETLRK
jgi:hypothetical protein